MIPTASADEPAWPTDAIEVGRVVDAWGIKGAIKVKPFASDPQALFSSRRWFLQPAEVNPSRPDPLAGQRAAQVPKVLRVSKAQEHGDVIVVNSPDIPDRNAAESLRGVRIFVSRASFPTPDPDEYYWIDLIGLNVVNRQGEALGVVNSLIDTGPHSVLRVLPEGGGEDRLIPFVAAYIDDVSLAERRIQVDWGLDYET
jgi:16S rRNA processing protein RimM